MNALDPLQLLLLAGSVGLVACLYSSVGHGGATGYLAAAAMLGLAPGSARPGALWLNCVVAGIAFWRFRRAGHFEPRLFAMLASASVPCAWFGARFAFQGHTYAIVLGAALAVAGWLLAREPATTDNALAPVRTGLPASLAAGGILGILAGMTGIGGGVFLSPLLVFLRWSSPKMAGGISALFIVVNSIAGLVGLGPKAFAVFQPDPLWALCPIAIGIAGALLGTHLGVHRWNSSVFRKVLAIVLWIAAAKLFITGK